MLLRKYSECVKRVIREVNQSISKLAILKSIIVGSEAKKDKKDKKGHTRENWERTKWLEVHYNIFNYV